MYRHAPVVLLLLVLSSCTAYPADKHAHTKGYRIMQEQDNSKPPMETRAAAITQAFIKDDATAAATSIAEATAAGDVSSVASALAFALANGKTKVAANALTEAMNKGSSTDALAQAASNALPAQAPKQDIVNAIEKKDPTAVADKLDKGYSSVKSVATSSSGTLVEAKNATASAVAAAIAQACQGDVAAASQAISQAVATASATAWSKSQATVTVEGNGQGCADASSAATAVAEAVATATSEAFAAAASNCAKAETAAKAVDTKTAIATAISETSASACSTGGTATATSEAVTQAVAKVTATAYVDVLAAVSGPCGGCGAVKPAKEDNKPMVQDQPAKKPDTAAQSEQPKATPHNHDSEESKSASDAGKQDSPLDVIDAPITTTSDDSSYTSRQQRKYKACYTWLKDDCCSGWRGSRQCHCFSFGMRGLGDVCQYKLVSDPEASTVVWQDRWSKERCQCDN